jgi:hypothetical protein
LQQVLKPEATWLGAAEQRVIAEGQQRSSEAIKEAARRQENFVRETYLQLHSVCAECFKF